MTGMLDPALLLQGYAAGIFPMADSRDADDVFWVEPRRRAILPLDRFHCSRSLARRIRSGRFEIRRDTAFAEVMAACGARDETWINRGIADATLALHAAGHAHSIECWHDDALVGGLYGVRVGAAFMGESMFSLMSDASKVALAWLVARLKVGQFTLLDCQFMTSHLASLGARQVSRSAYVALLGAALGAGSAAAGDDASLGAGELVGFGLPDAGRRADFGALDELLAAEGVAGAAGPSGQLIAQLLGHTS